MIDSAEELYNSFMGARGKTEKVNEKLDDIRKKV